MLLFCPDCEHFDCEHFMTMSPVHDMSYFACMKSCDREFDYVCFVLCTHGIAARAFSKLGHSKAMVF